jgi:hypothetical protein
LRRHAHSNPRHARKNRPIPPDPCLFERGGALRAAAEIWLALPARFLTLRPVKTQRKRQCSINTITPGRWTAYAAAGAASALTCANSAEAEIHYSGNVSIELTLNAHATLSLSNGAALAFKNYFRTTFIQTFTFVMSGVISGSARAVRYFPGSARLSNLPLGVNVSAGRFLSVTGHPNHGVLITNWSDGQFAPNSGPIRGFVGFRFNTGNGTQYGWARIQTENGAKNRIHDTIRDYAWGDVGDAISTGQTQSLEPANANSVPGSLGLLAFGAQGLNAWRTQCTQKSN